MDREAQIAQLLCVLDSKISRERAEQLLTEGEGSLDAAVAIFFSSSQPDAGNNGTSTSTPQQQLADILGPNVPQAKLRRLLTKAAGSVPRAADLFFSQAGHDTEAPAAAGPSQPAEASQQSPGSRGRRPMWPRARAHARPSSPFVSFDSDEDQPADSPTDGPGPAVDEPVTRPFRTRTIQMNHADRAMQRQSSAELFQGFVAAATSSGHPETSGDPELPYSSDLDDAPFSDPDNDPFADSDDDPLAVMPAAPPSLSGDSEHASNQRGSDAELMDEDVPQARFEDNAAGPSSPVVQARHTSSLLQTSR